MTRTEALETLLGADDLRYHDAVEFLLARIKPSDLPRVVAAFDHVRDPYQRIDLVDLAGKCGPGAIPFLLGVLRSRAFWLLRYYAARNLIDVGYRDWKPASRRAQRTDFYASLSAYESFLHGEMTREELRKLAVSRTHHPGDHWNWLKEPFNVPKRYREALGIETTDDFEPGGGAP